MGACVVVAATVPAAAVHCGCCSELGACAGGADQVAEMTGRSGRIVRKGNRGVCYEQRGAKEDDREKLNVNECQRFQNAEKFVAIISDAASTGISLHAGCFS